MEGMERHATWTHFIEPSVEECTLIEEVHAHIDRYIKKIFIYWQSNMVAGGRNAETH